MYIQYINSMYFIEFNTQNSTIVIITEEGMRWSGEDDGTFSVYFI